MPIEESWGCSFQEENHSGECTSRISLGREFLESVWGVNCREWSSTAIQLKDIAAKSRVSIESLDQYFVACSTQYQPRRPGIGSRVLRRCCLSTLQELVGRNGLPTLLSSSFKQVLQYFICCVKKLFLRMNE